MMQTGNPFKQAILAQKRQIGLWLSLANGYSAELCAQAEYDWMLIDGEHGPNDLRTIIDQLQALHGYRAHPVVRPPMSEPWLLKQLLDAGAKSFLIPMIDTAEQARQVVAATRYPPQGIRGVGARMARASGFGSRSDYIAKANDEICVLVQIESAEALENLEAIAAVEGVDGVFVGPSDLSASLGHTGNPGAVRAIVDNALGRIRKAGKSAGIIAFAIEDSTHFIEAGANFIAVGADAAILADNARKLAAHFAAMK
jgi:4-hydroxy-2-oxoheptanedioate aldolase